MPYLTDQQEEQITTSNPRKRKTQASSNQDTTLGVQNSSRNPPGRPLGTTDLRRAGTCPRQNKLSFLSPKTTDSIQHEQMQDKEIGVDDILQETVQQQTSNEQQYKRDHNNAVQHKLQQLQNPNPFPPANESRKALYYSNTRTVD